MGGVGHLWATALLWGKGKELSKTRPGHGSSSCVGLDTRGTFAKGFNPAWNSRKTQRGLKKNPKSAPLERSHLREFH